MYNQNVTQSNLHFLTFVCHPQHMPLCLDVCCLRSVPSRQGCCLKCAFKAWMPIVCTMWSMLPSDTDPCVQGVQCSRRPRSLRGQSSLTYPWTTLTSCPWLNRCSRPSRSTRTTPAASLTSTTSSRYVT